MSSLLPPSARLSHLSQPSEATVCDLHVSAPLNATPPDQPRLRLSPTRFGHATCRVLLAQAMWVMASTSAVLSRAESAETGGWAT